MTFNEKLRSFAFWLHFRSHQERFSFPPSDAGLASRRASHAPPARPCVGRQLREGNPEAGPAPGARGRNSGARVGPDARRAFTREGPARQRALRRGCAPPAATYVPDHVVSRRRLRARRRAIAAERRAAAFPLHRHPSPLARLFGARGTFGPRRRARARSLLTPSQSAPRLLNRAAPPRRSAWRSAVAPPSTAPRPLCARAPPPPRVCLPPRRYCAIKRRSAAPSRR